MSPLISYPKPPISRRIGMRWNKTYVAAMALLVRALPKAHRPIFCMGDSHVPVWNYVDMYAGAMLPHFVPFVVRGATALGLANPNSKTNALNEYRAMLARLPRSSKVLFNLGEVDCGFLIWLIAGRENQSVDVVFERALSSYTSFLEQTAAQGFRVTVSSAPMPTIGDGEPVGEVAKLRAGVRATQAQRTEMTRRWNAALKHYCQTHQMSFIDTDKFLLDAQTGLIRAVFKHSNPGDHHLDAHSYAAALLLAIAEAGATGLRAQAS